MMRSTNWMGLCLSLVLLGCAPSGGASDAALDGGTDPCAPNGTVHGSGASAHCDCNPGYRAQGLQCVASGDGGAMSDAADARPMDADGCGPNGVLHGTHCHCDAGYVERNLYCEALPACSMPDDPLEQNDAPAMSRALMAGTREASLRVCPGDEDWYHVNLMVGQTLTVDVLFTHTQGDIDAYLWVPGADALHTEPVASSDGTVDNERIRYTATTAGEHRFVVLGHSGAENAYQLNVTVTGP